MVSEAELEQVFRILAEELDKAVEQSMKDGALIIQESYVKGVQKGNKDLKLINPNLLDIGPDPSAIEFLEGYNFELIKGVSNKQLKEIKLIIRNGILNGKGIRPITKQLRDVYNGSKWRLSTIARTEVMRASNYGRYYSWNKSGVVKYKQWLTAYDDRVCPECDSMNGEVTPIGQSFSSGELMPPLHPNCRCTAIPYTKEVKMAFTDDYQPSRELKVKTLEEKYSRVLLSNFKKANTQIIRKLEVWWKYIR